MYLFFTWVVGTRAIIYRRSRTTVVQRRRRRILARADPGLCSCTARVCAGWPVWPGCPSYWTCCRRNSFLIAFICAAQRLKIIYIYDIEMLVRLVKSTRIFKHETRNINKQEYNFVWHQSCYGISSKSRRKRKRVEIYKRNKAAACNKYLLKKKFEAKEHIAL